MTAADLQALIADALAAYEAATTDEERKTALDVYTALRERAEREAK